MESSIYERERRDKVQKLRELGLDPFGGRTEGILPLAEVRALHKPEFGQDGGPIVTVSGRVMFRKGFGKLTFMTIRDETGDLQVAIDKKRVSERDWQANDLIDLGDRIVITGKLGATKTGEVTVWATVVAFAAKALLPPPAKWEGLSDVELRYRQRYVDLWANPQVMRTLKLRMQIVDEVRTFLKSKGFLEVETPMMQALAGGAAARPFVTHHNALDIPLYMRIAPELYLKRLLVGGFTKVFELNRNFRNEGISPRHNPEFTMLEAYEAFGSWETMADLVEEMICTVAVNVFKTLRFKQHGYIYRRDGSYEIGDYFVDLARPWPRRQMVDLVEEHVGWKFEKKSAPDEVLQRIVGTELRRRATARLKSSLDAIAQHDEQRAIVLSKEFETASDPWAWVMSFLGEAGIAEVREEAMAQISGWDQQSPAEQLVRVYEKLVERTLLNPTFVTHVPSVIIPLARKAKDDPFFADVYELAINGQEISPGYSELNDPDVQAENFTHQVGEDQQQIDHDFLNALRYGMPPAGGMGLGIDRLVMMLTGAESIRDVILFPLMKPQDIQAQHAQEPANPT